MKSENIKVQAIIDLFKKELSDLYPKEEIDSFIQLSFSHLLNFSKTDIIVKKQDVLKGKSFEKLNDIINKLKQNKPIQHIIGSTDFYDINLKVNKNVLIPRPETEELIDLIIKDVKNYNNKFVKILDIGTGSGCIPISLKKNLPDSDITSIDISSEAINTAIENSLINDTNIKLANINFLDKFTWKKLDRYDIIVSNPPYVRESEKELMHKNVLDYEPHTALFVTDKDPLIFYRNIFDFAISHLNLNGQIFLEINSYLGKEMYNLAMKYNFKEVQLIKDLFNKDRFIKCIS